MEIEMEELLSFRSELFSLGSSNHIGRSVKENEQWFKNCKKAARSLQNENTPGMRTKKSVGVFYFLHSNLSRLSCRSSGSEDLS